MSFEAVSIKIRSWKTVTPKQKRLNGTKATSLKSIKMIVSKLTILVNGTYHTMRFFTFTNPAKSDVCSMEQRSSTVHPYVTQCWPGLTWSKTYSTISFASASTTTPLLLKLKAYFCKLASFYKTNRYFVFLWREDPAEEIAVYQYVRHVFGAKELPTYANYSHQMERNRQQDHHSWSRS